MATVFKSPYPLTVPNVDLLTYVFSATVFAPDDKVWIEANDPSNYITQSRAVELTQRIGAGLRNLGLERPKSESEERNVVLLISENQIMTPVTMFGIINSGAIMSTVPPQASSFEIAKQIASCQPKLLICSPAILETAKEGVIRSVLKELPIAVMSSADGRQELKLVDGTNLIANDKLEFEKITDPSVLAKRVCFSDLFGNNWCTKRYLLSSVTDGRRTTHASQHRRANSPMGKPFPPLPSQIETKRPPNFPYQASFQHPTLAGFASIYPFLFVSASKFGCSHDSTYIACSTSSNNSN